jgi:hypothetical protein
MAGGKISEFGGWLIFRANSERAVGDEVFFISRLQVLFPQMDADGRR